MSKIITNIRESNVWLVLLMISAVLLLMSSCSKDDDPVTDPEIIVNPDDKDDGNKETEDDNKDADDSEDPEDGDDKDALLELAYVTDSVVYPKYPLLKNLNFVYPSKGPQGEPVMLSGTITMSNSMTHERRATGFILYNHYTICKASDCPTKGMLDMQNILYLTAPNRGFITVSADYYGFGATEEYMQAYCMPTTNARASIDALRAARKLLSDRGYTWGNDLLNIGYSQGGQTAIGVLKVAAEEYPDVHFTRTLAGGGPYDLEETYRQYLAEGSAKLPSAVVSILMAYNDYCQLGIPASSMFKGKTLDHLDDWWLSKKYTSTEIDRKMDSKDITTFIAAPLLDLGSEVSRTMMEALSRENLCWGWTPRQDENILLLHHESDDISPSVNTQLLYDFLKAQGVQNVEMRMADYFTLGISEHVSGAVAFLTLVSQWIRDNYAIQ